MTSRLLISLAVTACLLLAAHGQVMGQDSNSFRVRIEVQPFLMLADNELALTSADDGITYSSGWITVAYANAPVSGTVSFGDIPTAAGEANLKYSVIMEINGTEFSNAQAGTSTGESVQFSSPQTPHDGLVRMKIMVKSADGSNPILQAPVPMLTIMLKQ